MFVSQLTCGVGQVEQTFGSTSGSGIRAYHGGGAEAWNKGGNSHHKPSVVSEDGNSYLSVESFGHNSREGNPDSGLVFFSDTWKGKFSRVSALTAKIKNLGETDVKIRLALQSSDAFKAVSIDPVASVPKPAAFWLFGSAVFALIGRNSNPRST